jgi:FSR family fosmidomycin resistance protein-like MFS transporter
METSTDRAFNLRVLLVLSLGHLATDVYQGSLPAVLPFLKEKLSLSYTAAGVIVMASSITSSVIQPLFGFLSDRKEKPLLLPLGCLCAGAGFSLLCLPSSYAVILCLVILSGLGIASYHPEGYRTAYFFTGERKATAMSIFSVGGNLGFALGPLISLSIITHAGFSFLPVMMTFALLFVGVLATFWKKLALPKEAREARKEGLQRPAEGTVLALSLIIGIVVMRSWTQFGLMTYIPFYFIDYLKGEPAQAGKLLSIFLLGGVIGTLGGSPLADRWGHKFYLTLSMLFTFLIFPLIFIAKGIFLFLTLGVLGMVLISTFTVTIVMAQHLLPENLGVASGLMVGFAIGTGGIGVAVLGLAADNFGVPFALKAIILLPLTGLITSLLLRYPVKHGEAS